LNWVDQLRNADFILVACHSQGVPVGLMLIAKLIEFGVVSTARIGVCAMGECPNVPQRSISISCANSSLSRSLSRPIRGLQV
jgi:hypothetical protein